MDFCRTVNLGPDGVDLPKKTSITGVPLGIYPDRMSVYGHPVHKSAIADNDQSERNDPGRGGA